MILSCNSCDKKFVVPDNAISASGRLVQCSSCGSKWNQFPITRELNTKVKDPKKQTATKSIKKTRNIVRKKTGPGMYTPEYLAKKHGIDINKKEVVKSKNKENRIHVNFGFYSTLIVSLITITFFLRLLYLAQKIIIEKIPASEIYINYLFESLKNIKEISQNFILGY